MTTPMLHTRWLTPDQGRDLLVVGPSLGTGVVALWQDCAPRVAERAGVDVLAWDLPGHGDGIPVDQDLTIRDLAAAVVASVAEERPGTPFTHAGVSVAGATGLELAVLATNGQAPLRGSAVICADAKLGTAEAWHERADLVRAEGTEAVLAGSRERWFAPGVVERDPETATRLLETLRVADPTSYARVCEALAGYDVRPTLAGLTVPVLVLGGAHDVVCPPDAQRALADGIPGARLELVPDAAHLAPAEQPGAVAQILADWIAGLG